MDSTASALPRDDPGQGWASQLDLPDVGMVARIVRLNMLVTRLVDSITGPEGISTADYLVLGVLRRSAGHATSPSFICELLGRSTGGMTLTLDRLEAVGWVVRTQDPSDRRRVIVKLSPDGLELSTRINDALHAWEAGLELSAAERAEMLASVDELLQLFDA
jgi:DNA-binding MarR family transcriptional regulator